MHSAPLNDSTRLRRKARNRVGTSNPAASADSALLRRRKGAASIARPPARKVLVFIPLAYLVPSCMLGEHAFPMEKGLSTLKNDSSGGGALTLDQGSTEDI